MPEQDGEGFEQGEPDGLGLHVDKGPEEGIDQTVQPEVADNGEVEQVLGDDGRLSFDKASNEAWAVHEAATDKESKIPRAASLGEASARLAAIGNAQLNGSELAFLDREKGESLAYRVDIFNTGENLKSAQKELEELENKRSDGDPEYNGTWGDDRYEYRKQELEDKIRLYSQTPDEALAPELAEARDRVLSEVDTLKGSVKEAVERVSKLFDELRVANPERYTSLGADEMRKWVERLAGNDGVIEDWEPRIERYARQAEKVQKAINEGKDYLSRGNFMGNGNDIQYRLTEGFTTERQNELGTNRLYGLVEETAVWFAQVFGGVNRPERHEIRFIRNVVGRALRKIGDNHFTLSPKDKMEIYQQAAQEISDKARNGIEGMKTDREALLSIFSNGEDFPEPPQTEEKAA